MYNKRTSLKKLFNVIFLGMIGSSFAQQQNNAFTMQQAIEYAVKNSPNLMNAELDQQSSEYKKGEIRASGLPQINGSIDVKDYLEIPTSLIPAAAFNPLAPAGTYAAVKFGVKYNATAGVSASQLIFSADYLYGMKAANEFINLSRINTVRTKTELVTQVSKAYYTILVSKERLKALDANITRVDKVVSDYRALNAQGMAEQIDVERFEVTQNNLNVEREKMIWYIGLNENLLKFQMGYNLKDEIKLSDSLNVTEELKQELSPFASDISKRADYQLLKTQQTLYNIDVKRQQWGYLPTLAAYGSYQYNSQRSSTNFFESDKSNAMKQWYPIALIGITMNINIFDGLQRHYKIQQAKVTYKKAENSLKLLEQGAQIEANAAAVGFNSSIKSMKIQERNVELAKHVYDVAQKKYQQGVGNNMEMVNAQTALRESEVNYFNAVFDALMTKIDYQKATGTLVK